MRFGERKERALVRCGLRDGKLGQLVSELVAFMAAVGLDIAEEYVCMGSESVKRGYALLYKLGGNEGTI